MIRGECGRLVKDASWKMIFATSEEEFDQIWDDMVTQAEGIGWDELLAFDKEKYQVVIDARKAAK